MTWGKICKKKELNAKSIMKKTSFVFFYVDATKDWKLLYNIVKKNRSVETAQ